MSENTAVPLAGIVRAGYDLTAANNDRTDRYLTLRECEPCLGKRLTHIFFVLLARERGERLRTLLLQLSLYFG